MTGRGVYAGFACILSCAIVLCTVSCGIETVEDSLDPPSLRDLANPLDPGGRYFSFYTRETGNNGTAAFKGTDVFYKIYNNVNELNAEHDSIKTSNAEYSANGYNRMVSLNYRQLPIPGYPSILFSATGSNREVSIRLIDEGLNAQGAYDFPAGVVSGSNMGKPIRRPSSEGFNFYIDSNPDNCDKLPAAGDWDTRFSNVPEADTWYVNAYAVSVGQNTKLALLYSQLLWLGYIQIKKP
ncbi:MAG: hypothetical protein Pg6C_00760 [Treponemataceae bacterium]|nr:MAG: hypothetical protein Pg6C_00760 [Treponemataceae bacterium]